MMKAMLLSRLSPIGPNSDPLVLADLPVPQPGPGEARLHLSVCGVCHTELDEIEGRTPPPRLPVIPGHQAVGRVEALGAGVSSLQIGQRVGVAWIYSACEVCAYCQSGDENLCVQFRATGRDVNGGYAEFMLVPAGFAHPIPDALTDESAAPLLCAGAIGYRSLRLANLPQGGRLGLTGFGASAHLVLKLIQHLDPAAQVYVFSRSPAEQEFARQLGAAWAGDIGAAPPQPLQAVIDTTPAWKPVIDSLAALAPGGRLVINAIRKEDHDRPELLRLDYPAHIWMEKEIKSVANVTRADVSEFLQLAAQAGIRPEVELFALEDANRALRELKARKIRGAKVLKI
jgi:propanol-preferring alcohol dehydrogenase